MRGIGAPTVLWAGLSLLAAGGWYLTATRLMYRFGPDEAAAAVGLLVGLAVGMTVWRWGRDDRRSATLARGRCPRCASRLALDHQHREPARAALTRWSCTACGFDHGEPLTCEHCGT
jgi:ribosomal protein S27AE